MNSEVQSDLQTRVAKLDKVEAITFEARIENLMAQAAGLVCMGGYNTFCEVLSFDKRALLVPRTEPRMEQYIRASRAQDLGLVRMLLDDGHRDSKLMAAALRSLPQQHLPSEVVVPGLLDGTKNLVRLADHREQLTSEVGGHDPFAAISRVMERSSFDEIIISTLPSAISRWLKMDLPSRVERAFSMPVVVINPPSD